MHYGHQKLKRPIQSDLRSVGNLALAPESLVTRHNATDTLRSPRSQSLWIAPQSEGEDGWEADALARIIHDERKHAGWTADRVCPNP